VAGRVHIMGRLVWMGAVGQGHFVGVDVIGWLHSRSRDHALADVALADDRVGRVLHDYFT
jgi:hypothetical protein